MRKKRNVRVTTTAYDRVQALIRNPGYLKNLHELTGGRPGKIHPGMGGCGDRMGELYKKFLTKYKITIPLYPSIKNWPRELIEGYALFTDDDIARVIPYNKKRKIVDAGVIIDGGEEILIRKSDISPHLRDGKYLCMELNLEGNKETVLAKVENLIDVYQRHVHRKVTRDTPSRKIDKFEVWDEYMVTRNFSKIAKKRKVKVSTLRAAYYRAFELIMGEKYDPSRHNRKLIKKEQLAITCDTCNSRQTCETLCPVVLAYCDQDYAAQKERQFIDALDFQPDKE